MSILTPTDNSDLTDEVILKILIERERNIIIGSRKMTADNEAADRRIMDYVKKYGTDEG